MVSGFEYDGILLHMRRDINRLSDRDRRTREAGVTNIALAVEGILNVE